jgi:rRNA maturation endonuclease Nob1
MQGIGIGEFVVVFVVIGLIVLFFSTRKRKTESEVKLYCQQCRTTLHPASRFCNSCGAQIPFTNLQ